MNSKQREELQRISAAITVNTLPNGVRTIACKMSAEEVKHIVDTILAAPPRNCNRFKTKEEAALAYAKERNAFIPQSILWQIGEWLDWLFAEAKGDAK